MVTQRYRVEVGYEHGVKPGQIVGAIANEANIESAFIGHIEIFDTFTTVDLPEGMPTETMDVLKRARVCGRQLDISHFTGQMPERSERRNKPFGDRRPRPEGGRDRPFGDRGDFKRNAPRKFDNKPKFDKGGRNDR